jgi:hypothetical protein
VIIVPQDIADSLDLWPGHFRPQCFYVARQRPGGLRDDFDRSLKNMTQKPIGLIVVKRSVCDSHFDAVDRIVHIVEHMADFARHCSSNIRSLRSFSYYLSIGSADLFHATIYFPKSLTASVFGNQLE